MNNKSTNILLALFGLVSLVIYLIGHFKGFTYEIGIIKASSMLQISLFLFGALIIHRLKRWLKKIDYEILMPILFLILMLSAFEMMLGFHYWFSSYALAGTNIDELSYTPQNNFSLLTAESSGKVNMNIMTKMSALSFFLTLYLFYTAYNLKKTKSQ